MKISPLGLEVVDKINVSALHSKCIYQRCNMAVSQFNASDNILSHYASLQTTEANSKAKIASAVSQQIRHLVIHKDSTVTVNYCTTEYSAMMQNLFQDAENKQKL